jgi:hypothetical protein
MEAATLALTPLLLLIPVFRLADYGAHTLAGVLPILMYAPLAMWMESRSITLLLVTCRGRRDPFLVAAVPIGATALAAYLCCAFLFAVALPTVLHLLQ